MSLNILQPHKSIGSISREMWLPDLHRVLCKQCTAITEMIDFLREISFTGVDPHTLQWKMTQGDRSVTFDLNIVLRFGPHPHSTNSSWLPQTSRNWLVNIDEPHMTRCDLIF